MNRRNFIGRVTVATTAVLGAALAGCGVKAHRRNKCPDCEKVRKFPKDDLVIMEKVKCGGCKITQPKTDPTQHERLISVRAQRESQRWGNWAFRREVEKEVRKFNYGEIDTARMVNRIMWMTEAGQL